MPPAKVMATEGGPTELFQWGATNMSEWRRDAGYSTTNASYNGGFSMDRKSRRSLRESTPWSTTNDSYGKGVLGVQSEQGGVGSYQCSVNSYRSQPGFKGAPASLSLTTDPVSARAALEDRFRYGVRPTPPPSAVLHTNTTPSLSGNTPTFQQFSLPPLDPSKYLVAQGPLHPHWYKAKPVAEPSKTGTGKTEDVSKSQREPPPKTGPAKHYMRDTLDRFLRSIPEELRPRTRKLSVQPREGPQILKVVHCTELPDRHTRSVMSHAIPSPPSSAGSSSSSSGSGDGVVDLRESTYDLRKELEEGNTHKRKTKEYTDFL